ncbi:serine-arginine protein 55 isoform X3 [Athalia rosae]|uniref:serine-arginine protein 55 isoform X3 n=1 Tax=Athalia rosae TaxID=37344 RepID=UPI0006253715|nr:serine-arginine protein 55 isoform X3 [Athalia rosae]
MVGTRVYVGGLPYGTRERDLEKFFRGYGRFRDVLIKNGYGFVEFDDYRDADDAVYELNGKELLGERVAVEIARGVSGRRGDRGYGRSRSWRDNRDDMRHDRDSVNRNTRTASSYKQSLPRYGPPTRTEYRLTVENLSSRVSWQDLKDYMRQAGEVTYADAHKQRRNEGVVEFATYSDLKNAIDKLDDTELNGRRIRLIEDKRRGRRSRSSSSRSRSHSRSRSPRRRSRTRSRSPRSSRSRSPRSSRSKSRPHSKSKSKSKSKSPERSRSRSKSKSRDRSKSKSKSKSISRSRSRSKAARSKSRSQSKSKAKSPSKDRSSRERSRVDRSRSRSVSKHSKSHSRSRSPMNGDKSPEKEKDD